jgi:acetate---CoA ligase (ADP-forming)
MARSPRCRSSPDCVVLVVPRDGVEAALEEAAAAGAGGAIVYASGYGELAREEAAAAQLRLAAIARAAKMPMLGPNCMGLVNHALGAGMTFIPDYPRVPRNAGSIAVVSQSGALGYALAQAWSRGLGVRYFFSAGNSADVDVADLVAAMADDPAVKAIACLFEGVPSAARLLEAGARARAAGKPVVVFKLGTSEDGAAAARSHTGSLAGSAAAWRALFERAGFVPVEDFESLLEYASFFAAAGAPRARGVAVLSGSGGAGVMAADKASRHGVPMPQPLAATAEKLRSYVPDYGSARNPCDPTGQVLNMPEAFGQCCRALLEDPQYGALVVGATVAVMETTASRVATLGALAREIAKPIAVVWLSEWLQGPGAEDYEKDERLPVFRSMERCFAAIAAWQAHTVAPFHQAPRLAPPQAAQEARRHLSASAEGTALSESEAKRVLACYGVPVVEERLAGSVEEAVSAARQLRYPVAMKAESPTILHKTELGVVKLGLADEATVRATYAEIVAAAKGHALRGVLVQPMVPGRRGDRGRARRSRGRASRGGGLGGRARGARAGQRRRARAGVGCGSEGDARSPQGLPAAHWLPGRRAREPRRPRRCDRARLGARRRPGRRDRGARREPDPRERARRGGGGRVDYPPPLGGREHLQPYDPRDNERDAGKAQRGRRLAEEVDSEKSGARGADPGPHRIGGPDRQGAHGKGEQHHARHHGEPGPHARPQAREAVGVLEPDRPADLEQARHHEQQPGHGASPSTAAT